MSPENVSLGAALIIARRDADALQLAKSGKTPTLTGEDRTENTTWQVDPFFPADVRYTVELSVTSSLGSPQTARALLFHGPHPVVVTSNEDDSDGEAFLSAQQGLSLSVSLITITRPQITTRIPAGHYVTIVSSGAGTATVVRSREAVDNG